MVFLLRLVIVGISIHAPRAGSDALRSMAGIAGRYFNPRSPCGERRGLSGALWLIDNISIHAPRAGSDIAP